jgi:hypothetical protein
LDPAEKSVEAALIPLWVKRLLDRWMEEAGVREGFLFRLSGIAHPDLSFSSA